MTLPRSRLSVSLLAATATLAVGLGACGGDTAEKNDYVDDVNEVTTTLNNGLTEVSSKASLAASPPEAATVFTNFGSTLGTAATDVDAITPPDDVAELHTQLVGNLETLRDEATNAANEVGAGGAASVPGVTSQFLDEAGKLSADIDATIAEINSELQE